MTLAGLLLVQTFLFPAPREPGQRVAMRLDRVSVDVIRTPEGVDSIHVTSASDQPIRIVSSVGVPVKVVLQAQPQSPPKPAPVVRPPWREPWVVGEVYGGWKFYRWADHQPKANVGAQVTVLFPAYYFGLQPSLRFAADRDVHVLSSWVGSIYAQVQIFKY